MYVMPIGELRSLLKASKSKGAEQSSNPHPKCSSCNGFHAKTIDCPNTLAQKDPGMKALIASGKAKKCDYKDRSRPGNRECGGVGHMRKHHIQAVKAASGPGVKIRGQAGSRTFRGVDKFNRPAVTLRFFPEAKKPVPKWRKGLESGPFHHLEPPDPSPNL